MTYLLSQIFISLLLAGLAGGAFGWILHGFKAHQRERELKSTLERHNGVLAQAQQERQMIADDYDEMKLGLESRISELQFENRKLPDLEENLEKSQQLVIQMIKKHEAETGELAAMNNELHSELENLKAGRKPTSAGSTATATTETHRTVKAAEPPGDTKLAGLSASSANVKNSKNIRPDHSAKVRSANLTASALNSAQQPSIDGGTVKRDAYQPGLGNLKAADSSKPVLSGTESPNRSQVAASADSDKHWDEKVAEQNELLALESEIEEMRAMDGHIAPSDSHGEDLEHERELDLEDVADSNTMELARDIDQEIATPVMAENIPDLKDAEGNSTSIVKAELDDKNEGKDNDEDSDNLRSSLRKKFSDKSDDDVDDLQIIHGIGPVIERSLNDIGITSFHQLATLTRHEIEEVADILKIFPGRIERDNWIGNARRLVSTDQKESHSSDSGSSHSRPDTEELENA